MGYVWLDRIGWVKKQTSREANYENMGEGWQLFINLVRWFPDFFLDLCLEPESEFNLTFTQRIMLRVNAQYKNVAITGCRGLGKSYTTDAGAMVDGEVWPGQELCIISPTQKQGAEIEAKVYKQVEKNFPYLTSLYKMEANSTSSGRFIISTEYKTNIAIGSFRGNSVHGVVAEETAQEEVGKQFDAENFRKVVIPAIRSRYRIGKEVDRAYIKNKIHSITSAGRRQNYAYEFRQSCLNGAASGKSAFVLDVPYQVLLLDQMRDIDWAESNRGELTLYEFMAEMESIYSGSDKNPIVRDEVLTESRNLLLMEEHHCCKDRDNKLKPEDVIYVVGYDVSYRDAKANAKCAVCVMKLTRQTEDFFRRDKYKKQIVWLEDWTPAEAQTPIAQAKKLKRVWNRYVYEGSQTYIAIDAWQYGDGVLTALMSDLQDGMAPLCCYNHSQYTELELQGAIPVVYPIKAGGVGTTDPDSEMVLYMEQQFENGNVQLLTGNMNDGVEAYKKFHRMKSDEMDARIAYPYKQTNVLTLQIQNLREEPSGSGIKERRISNHIQRDYWSAAKYCGRIAQILERANLQLKRKKSDWDDLLDKYKNGNGTPVNPGVNGNGGTGRMVIGRKGGRLF